tara:strand:+ start:228 stop:653 length:426 start_codon:yes stop_codon:yes gene_type:complete
MNYAFGRGPSPAKIMRASIIPLIILFAFSNPLIALERQSCEDSPKDGVRFTPYEGGKGRIISTQSVEVPFDDQELISNSLERAKILAKIGIRRFLSEDLRVGDDNSIILRDYFQGNLKGMIHIGSCYEPYKFIRTSYGLKF